jgi:Flp pilus assembly pilin Flp
MLQLMRKRLAAYKQEEGATATEYVLLLAGIAVIIIVAVFAFGKFLSTSFSNTQQSISTGANP